MTAFCAICTGSRGPFASRPLGRHDAMVAVCSDCDTETPDAWVSDRGYDVPLDVARSERAISMIASTTGGGVTTRHRRIAHRNTKTPGFILERVPVRTADGRRRDQREAAAEAFAGCSWAGEVRYLGIAKSRPSDFHLFERPDPDHVKRVRQAPMSEVVDELDKWRTK